MTETPEQEDSAPEEQPLVSHLVELRDRLMRTVIAVLVIFVGLFPFANDIYQFVSRPLLEVLPEGHQMIATGVISPFLAPFKLSLVVAIFIAMPYILYQLWAFVAPGLYKHEKRVLMPMVGSSALLFYLGAAFAYFVVFPLVFAFMHATTPDGVNMAPDISQYLEFVLTLFFAFGLAFEVPIATIILVWMGLTTPDKLVEKRPYVIVGAFCIGMLLTPPDVISQTLLALPMWLLFEVGVWCSRLIAQDRAQREAAKEADSEPQPTDQQPSDEPSAPEQEADPIDEERYQRMSEDELDAELAEIDEEFEQLDSGVDDPIDAKLQEANRLRDQEDEAGARKLLYEVLREGSEEQVVVAQNILAQLDG
jgi:sec-independent protein translocase protein TatC